jgi:cobalamin biosynthesis Mg chelatase CobN
MSEINETIEKAHEGAHSEFFNKRIALLIAVLALFLSFSETLGKSAQTEAISANVESSNLWAFFQAKSIRKTQVDTAAEEMKVSANAAADTTTKAAMQKQIDSWKQTAARYDSEPSTGEGRKELADRAKEAEERRDLAFQIGIVLASAAVITGMVGLAWFGGVLGVVGVALALLGLFAPHAVPFLATL